MAGGKRWIWRVGLAAAVAALAWLALRTSSVEVELSVVVRGPLETVVEEEGRTRPRDRFLLSAPITGALARIQLEEGDVVEAGDILARLFPTEQDPRALEMASAELTAARAQRVAAELQVLEASALARQSEREAERRTGLFELGAISRESMERAELAAETARRQADAAQSRLDGANAAVVSARARAEQGGGSGGDPIVLRAPTRGTVLRVFEESERTVAAGTPLLELADVTGLELVVDVLSEDAVGIAVGNRMRVTEWGGQGHLEGTVRLVQRNAFTKVSALGVEEQRVDVIGDLAMTPPSLGVGYRFVAQIVTWSGEALTVPGSALFRAEGGWSVFVVENGRVRIQQVEVGRRGVVMSEIVEGLEEGIEVVAFPSDQVADGVRVRRVGTP